VKRWRHYQKGTAIVLSSFGSVVAAERYENLKAEAEKRFPDADVFLSFSSRTVLKRFRAKGNPYESLPEALARLDLEGYKRVVISSVNLFPTDEHELLLRIAEGFRNFSPANIRVTNAIFSRTRTTSEILATLSSQLHEKDPADRYLYVAHGSPYLDQGGLNSYSYAREFLRELSEKNFLCTLEGTFPCGTLLSKMISQDNGKSSLVIVPLLLVSGRHFEEDIGEIMEKLAGSYRARVASSFTGEHPFHLLERDDVQKAILDEIDLEIQKIP
jgi:sirohydrochlorin cobaltochelatase